MPMPHHIKKYLAPAALALGLGVGVPAPAWASTPGCVGKMWNPLTDLDFRLMGAFKIGGYPMMNAPENLKEPPKHKAEPGCFCKNGLKTGFGIGLTFWMPSYINDMARQAGCIGFLGGTNILPGFISLSSGQEYNFHSPAKEGVTNMQVHWAYADVVSLTGKSLFEKCDMVSGAMTIAYMTEPDFIFQNDVYSVVMTPQAAILASVPVLSQTTCGFESIANTLGGWQDWGVCAWKGSRLPYSGTAIAKDSAQVSNMDITIKYLSRAALLGTTMRTMGKDVTCKPKYSPFYDPFQHRYQWSYPNKVSTRFNVDMLKWGLFVKDGGAVSMTQIAQEAQDLAGVEPMAASGTPGAATAGDNNVAANIIKKLPKPLNYPTREAGYMQVWEARQCCLMVLTVENALNAVIQEMATMGGGIIKEMYDAYNMANQAYQIIKDPIGGALGMVGDYISESVISLANSSGLTESLKGVSSGISESIGSLGSGSSGGLPAAK